jgi:isopentenyl phosphate kinase
MVNPPLDQNGLIFLKLGGSLITDKERAHTARMDVLHRLAGEVVAAQRAHPFHSLVLGHGSGSFGHVPAQKFGTRDGVKGEKGWRGFLEVWQEARELNRLVLNALDKAGLPVISFPPSASVVARDGQVESWDLEPLRSSLQAGLTPLVFGDVVFDRVRGGTILSTEDLFGHLTFALRPKRILLAGIEPGVWADYPDKSRCYAELTPHQIPELPLRIAGSSAIDVTGGMASKVLQSLELVKRNPGLEILIFSGLEPGLVEKVLTGEYSGTVLRFNSLSD